MKRLLLVLAACGSHPAPPPADPGTPMLNPRLTAGDHAGYRVAGEGTTCVVYPGKPLPELEGKAKLIYVSRDLDSEGVEHLRGELAIERLCLLGYGEAGAAVVVEYARTHADRVRKLVLYQAKAPSDLQPLVLDHPDADAFEKFIAL